MTRFYEAYQLHS